MYGSMYKYRKYNKNKMKDSYCTENVIELNVLYVWVID